MTKSSQVIFIKGKEKALEKLFSEVFGYLAIGYDENDEGFEDGADKTITEKGFKEISTTDEPTYQRIKLENPTVTPDYDTGKVLVRFTAELPTSNIANSTINQMAVVDTAESNAANTTYYSATTFPSFPKTDSASMTFILGFRM